MGRKPKVGSRPNEFKYGMPLYGTAWPLGDHFFACGGGGHGIANRIVWARFSDGRCSDQVGEYKLGASTPMRMALAPSGSGLLLGMSDGGLRRFQLDLSGPTPRVIEVSAAFAERIAELSEEVTAMAFSGEGGLLAVGFATGLVKVVAYPTMKPMVEWRLAQGVRDLDFARDAGGTTPSGGPLLATMQDNGACQLWDVRARQEVCSLALPRGLEKGKFARCRFSRSHPILYVAINQTVKGPCHMAAYGPESALGRRSSLAGGGRASAGGGGGGGGGWALLKRAEVDPDPNAAMEISHSGRLLALGTSEGGLRIVDASSLHVVRREEVSISFVTRMAFSGDDARVLAVAGDANAFALDLRDGGGGGGSGGSLCLLLLLLLAAAAAALAYLLQADPAAAARAAELWQALQADARVRAGLQLTQSHAHGLGLGPAPLGARVQQLASQLPRRDEL